MGFDIHICCCILLSIYIFFRYYQTEEYQEYRLFKSEYNTYVKKRKTLITERKNKENQIFQSIDRFSDKILDQELRSTSINKIDDFFGIGEKTVQRLYDSGYKTLRDLDSFRFQRSNMPDYVGESKYRQIKKGYNEEKKKRKERINNEIIEGFYSNTENGRKIEELKEEFWMYSERIEELSRTISSFSEDLQRYDGVSFTRFLRNDMEIPFEEVSNLNLRKTEYLVDKIQVRLTGEEIQQFRGEFHVLRDAFPESYELALMRDEETGRHHFFMIHEYGISYFYKGDMRITYFREIKCCSKIGKKLLLKLEKVGKIRIELQNDVDLIYNCIRALKNE
jgi:hypothetical protein